MIGCAWSRAFMEGPSMSTSRIGSLLSALAVVVALSWAVAPRPLATGRQPHLAPADQASPRSATPGPAAAPLEEWDDPAVQHVGTERPHATMTTYPSAELARAGDRTASPWFRLLNGTWKFRYSPGPAARPVGFERPGFDDSGWSDITVPANWEVQGFGMPIYSDSDYPFAFDAAQPAPARTTTTPSARTARRSPCRPTGPAAASSCTSTAWTRRSTSGSTGSGSASARTAARRPSST